MSFPPNACPACGTPLQIGGRRRKRIVYCPSRDCCISFPVPIFDTIKNAGRLCPKCGTPVAKVTGGSFPLQELCLNPDCSYGVALKQNGEPYFDRNQAESRIGAIIKTSKDPGGSMRTIPGLRPDGSFYIKEPINSSNNRKTPRIAESEKCKEICPVCGTQMIQRNGRYGTFFGCTRYPKCYGTRAIVHQRNEKDESFSSNASRDESPNDFEKYLAGEPFDGTMDINEIMRDLERKAEDNPPENGWDEW